MQLYDSKLTVTYCRAIVEHMIYIKRVEQTNTQRFKFMSDNTTFSPSFKPALNKSGLARCEYIGYEIKQGVSKKTDKEGEIVEKPWSLLAICFEVRGTARGTSQKMTVTTGFDYDPENALGHVLKSFGYEPPKVELTVDDEGFEVEAVEEDEDGFETSGDMDLGIEEFLETSKGKVFTAKVYKATEGKQKGYWQIDYKSLSLMTK